MNCKLCGSSNIRSAYEGMIRDGKLNNYTTNVVKMYECMECSTIWHEDLFNNEEFYETEEYRNRTNGTSDIQEFYKRHDGESMDKFKYTGTEIFRGKTVADIGCGGGAFVDYINSVAEKIIAIEPSKVFSECMKKKGYETYSYANEALKELGGAVADVVVSFDVIEHTENPIEFLKEAYELLKEDGIAVIGTPTDAPIMRALLGSEFEKVLFCTQHPWILREGSFNYMANQIGIKKYTMKYYQRYGLGNLLHWMKERKPCGHAGFDFISKSIDMAWMADIEKQGKSDYIVMEIRK